MDEVRFNRCLLHEQYCFEEQKWPVTNAERQDTRERTHATSDFVGVQPTGKPLSLPSLGSGQLAPALQTGAAVGG